MDCRKKTISLTQLFVLFLRTRGAYSAYLEDLTDEGKKTLVDYAKKKT